MTAPADRCARCDREECEWFALPSIERAKLPREDREPGRYRAWEDCCAHAVDWRARALAAEAAREEAERRAERLAEDCGGLRRDSDLLADDRNEWAERANRAWKERDAALARESAALAERDRLAGEVAGLRERAGMATEASADPFPLEWRTIDEGGPRFLYASHPDHRYTARIDEWQPVIGARWRLYYRSIQVASGTGYATNAPGCDATTNAKGLVAVALREHAALAESTKEPANG